MSLAGSAARDSLKVTQRGAGEPGFALGSAQLQWLPPRPILPDSPSLQASVQGPAPSGEIKCNCLELTGRESTSLLIALIPIFTNC